MFHELVIENFRGFSRFEMNDIGRVNLLVGKNNCGKTSVLEAIQLLMSYGDPGSVWTVSRRRGEEIFAEGSSRKVNISHLFHGHDVGPGSNFYISADEASLTALVEDRPQDRQATLFEEEKEPLSDSSEELEEPLALDLQWRGKDQPLSVHFLAIGKNGGLPFERIRRLRGPNADGPRTQFVTTAALSPSEVVYLFDKIVLTPEEDAVVQAVRTIEPSIQRIAAAARDSQRFYSGEARGGMFVKCEGIEPRIPIGTMGDGIWRMMGLALSLARAEGGVLLVDEIDTGLHYSVMEMMWKLVALTAERLDVQVFATSHSRDCYESLAVTARDLRLDSETGKVTIQRIERGEPAAIAFSQEEIIIAAERGLEVR